LADRIPADGRAPKKHRRAREKPSPVARQPTERGALPLARRSTSTTEPSVLETIPCAKRELTRLTLTLCHTLFLCAFQTPVPGSEYTRRSSSYSNYTRPIRCLSGHTFSKSISIRRGTVSLRRTRSQPSGRLSAGHLRRRHREKTHGE
jgi:hypothetical protein